MDIKRAKKVLLQVSDLQGNTVEEVISEIDKTIEEALKNAHEKNDKEKLGLWEKISRDGSAPSAAELVAYLGEKLVKKMAEPPVKDEYDESV